MWPEIIAGAAVVVVAVIEAFAASERRSAKKHRERSERREAERAKENRLAMNMMAASLELGLATALAVEQGKVNGELSSARTKVRLAQEEYRTFIQEIASRQVAKV